MKQIKVATYARVYVPGSIFKIWWKHMKKWDENVTMDCFYDRDVLDTALSYAEKEITQNQKKN
jgi:hypothetical protein